MNEQNTQTSKQIQPSQTLTTVWWLSEQEEVEEGKSGEIYSEGRRINFGFDINMLSCVWQWQFYIWIDKRAGGQLSTGAAISDAISQICSFCL